MAINLEESTVAIRESRLGGITGYDGDICDLCRQTKCGSADNRERCFSQAGSCISSALHGLANITDIAVINHAPQGCTAFAPDSLTEHGFVAKKRGVPYHTVILGTDINEKDTVFGATDSLKEIVLETYRRYKPKAIFIGTSCTSGIIGEDIDSVVDELKQELPIPVASVHCEGFKSKILAGRFDLVDHAVLTSIVKPPRKKNHKVNFKNFNESAREEITELFANFGVEPFFFYATATVEELSHLSESLATVCICGSLGTYIGNALEEKYGVPYIKTIDPLGIVGFETWLRALGKVIAQEAAVEAYIERERALYLPQIEAVKRELQGLRAVVNMGPGFAFQISRVLQELGIKLEYVISLHHDSRFDDGEVPAFIEYYAQKENAVENFKVSISDQQNFEIMNILNAFKPDIYLSRHSGTTVGAIKQGVASLFVGDEYKAFGYKGTLDFAQTILYTVKNRSFEKNLAARVKLPYTAWWYKQNSAAFLKEEVE
jgi:Nitrogenase molybdenum-iron protein, alpha and beta chains